MKHFFSELKQYNPAKAIITNSQTIILTRKLVNIIKSRMKHTVEKLYLSAHKRVSIDHKIIANQSAIIKCMESDTQRKAKDIASLRIEQGLHFLTHFLHLRLMKVFHVLVSHALVESKEPVVCKKQLQISVDQLEERKTGLPSSQATDCVSAESGLCLFPPAKELTNVIEEAKESLEVTNTNLEERGQETATDAIDEGMSYLTSAEERVLPS